MQPQNERDLFAIVTSLVTNCGLVSPSEAGSDFSKLRLTSLAGDGSSRQFCRVTSGDKVVCLAVAPGPRGDEQGAEARSTRLIGSHLHRTGAPVPAQYGYSEEHGIILFEDLGDTKLHDLVKREGGSVPSINVEKLRPWYHQVLENLVVMQVRGAKTFDPEWCWQGKRYDAQLMLEKESGYFCRSFLIDFLGCRVPSGIKEEFVEIARICEGEPASYFLHRDFQSRNIMIQGDRVRFIDFQGGRLGPLQYDLASLLIDPYVCLPHHFQAELIDYYLECIKKEVPVNVKQFLEKYDYLALQRNLQIVGAFSFLSGNKKKLFFKQYISPALQMLNDRLVQPCFDDFPIVRKTVASSFATLNAMQNREK